MSTSTGREDRRAFRVVTSNRRAYHDYFILETLETGIALTGTEIKSIRAGKISLVESFARIQNGELWLLGAHIAPYSHGGVYSNHDPLRPRKLLAHKDEIRKLKVQVEQKGMALVPLKVILKEGKAKIEIGTARGKKLVDKRASEAERDAKRDIDRALRGRNVD